MGLKTAGGWLLFSSRTLSSRSFPPTGRALPQSNLTDEKSPEKAFNKVYPGCTALQVSSTPSPWPLSPFPSLGFRLFCLLSTASKESGLSRFAPSKENRSLCGLYSAVMGRVHFLPAQVENGPSTSMSLRVSRVGTHFQRSSFKSDFKNNKLHILSFRLLAHFC